MRTKTLLTLIALTAILTVALPALGQGQAGTTLSATKTATGYWEREFEWTIDKSVTPATWNLFTGDSGTSQYTITVTKSGPVDTYGVRGEICVTNGGDRTTENLKLVDQVEYKTGSGQFQPLWGASQTIIPAAQLEPGETGCYNYDITFTPVAGATYRNSVKVTITNHSGHLGEEYGPEPKTGFSLPTTPTLINASVNVDDTNGGSWVFSDSGSVSYAKTFTCDADEGTHGNTATIRETGQSDSASVMVNCYTPTVSKTAVTLFTRTYSWTIDKVGDQTALTLSTGQTFDVNYDVTVSATYTDSDWLVGGVISVVNPHPTTALTVDVTDMVSPDIAAWVDCDFVTEGNQPSLTVPALGTGACNYGASLPDAAQRTNTATATLQNYDYDKDGVGTESGTTTDFSGTADVIFPATPTTEIDECIDVTDDQYGYLGQACVGVTTLPKTFEYTLTVGPYDVCGEYEFVNTASFVTNDSGKTGSDSVTVTVHVPCAGGCTLTPGYWKTHSELGPAPYDDTWLQVTPGFRRNGANYVGGWDMAWVTPDFAAGDISGADRDGITTDFKYVLAVLDKKGNVISPANWLTYHDALWTPVAGRPWFILARAYVAAYMNSLNGATVPASVQTALQSAYNYLSQNDPYATLSRETRNQMISVASYLDQYNNGYLGVPHCDEDSSSGS